MERVEATELLARLHSAQNSFYSGGGEGELRALLAPDIIWHVPGRNLIAGTYRGYDEVIGGRRPGGRVLAHANRPRAVRPDLVRMSQRLARMGCGV